MAWLENQLVLKIKHDGTNNWIKTQDLRKWTLIPRTATSAVMASHSKSGGRVLDLKLKDGEVVELVSRV